jgi:hypothetical protein
MRRPRRDRGSGPSPVSRSALSLGVALTLGALSAGCSDDPVPLPVEHLVTFSAGLDFAQGTLPEAMQVDLLVTVARQMCTERCGASIVPNAVVEADAGNGRIMLDYDGQTGDYHGVSLGYAPRYTVTVRVDGETLEREAESPSLYSFQLSPEPPIAGAEAAIVWSPSLEPGVTAVAQVSGPSGTTYLTSAANDYPDDGREDLPASALPLPGTYEVTLQRRRAESDGPSFGSVTILARSEVVVEPAGAR